MAHSSAPMAQVHYCLGGGAAEVALLGGVSPDALRAACASPLLRLVVPPVAAQPVATAPRVPAVVVSCMAALPSSAQDAQTAGSASVRTTSAAADSASASAAAASSLAAVTAAWARAPGAAVPLQTPGLVATLVAPSAPPGAGQGYAPLQALLPASRAGSAGSLPLLRAASSAGFGGPLPPFSLAGHTSGPGPAYVSAVPAMVSWGSGAACLTTPGATFGSQLPLLRLAGPALWPQPQIPVGAVARTGMGLGQQVGPGHVVGLGTAAGHQSQGNLLPPLPALLREQAPDAAADSGGGIGAAPSSGARPGVL
jgi:hypothetical protein